jgi:hypothetical protein
MFLNNASFDAVITDVHGRSIEVDCRVTEPMVSGSPASISIEIPLGQKQQGDLKNPCVLSAKNGCLEIQIKDLWYRSIPAGSSDRKHARGIFSINHAGHLWVRRSHWTSNRAQLRFLLSPIRFFKTHSRATMVNYTATPNMAVELFKLHTAELGEIRFIKYWFVHHIDKGGFAAEIRPQELPSQPVEQLVEKMRNVLIPLSILTRQAITLHGWVWEKQEGIETMWFNPLDPNLAPDMAEEPAEDVCFPEEFMECAQIFTEKFIEAPPDLKEVVTLISIGLAPHVKRSTAGNFSALFGAWEQVIGLNKLTSAEKDKLHETDEELIEALDYLKINFRKSSTPSGIIIEGRIEGLINKISNPNPSFKVRFEKLQAAYPQLIVCTGDLWPVFGTEKKPGLKNVRDSLAHGLQAKYNPQAIAVAHWHFSRLSERLAFIVLGIKMPAGLCPNSYLLRRDPWYGRTYWEALRISAKSKNA